MMQASQRAKDASVNLITKIILLASSYEKDRKGYLAMRSKRSREVIISKMLEVCRPGASKTRIVYEANLNFKTINPYIEFLIMKGFLQVKSGQMTLYETTQKGIDLQDSLKQVQDELSLL
jgi:predicted transcriptional regulator